MEQDDIQHPLSLPELLERRREPPVAVCGIYFLFDATDLIYVGQSVDVEKRVRDHAVHRKFSTYAFIECTLECLDDMEALYLLVYRPPQNSLQGSNLGRRHPPGMALFATTKKEYQERYRGKKVA